MMRINARTSLATAGRLGLPCRIFQAQNKRKPFQCQPMTVDALTTKMLDCQSSQTAHSQAVIVIERKVVAERAHTLPAASLPSAPRERELPAARKSELPLSRFPRGKAGAGGSPRKRVSKRSAEPPPCASPRRAPPGGPRSDGQPRSTGSSGKKNEGWPSRRP